MSDETPSVTTTEAGVARISWPDSVRAQGWLAAVDVVRREVATALVHHRRVEALVDPASEEDQRIATWSGLQREGVLRGAVLENGEHVDRVIYARLATDVAVEEPDGFRALLNSFLPRKRAISQMLVRDTASRVLMCRLTYKQDWDLPGGVVEVGESPQLAVSRELEEELGLQVRAGGLLLTDWMPPWGGWDDALCLVFDGGVHDPGIVRQIVHQEREIRDAAFLSEAEVRERAADFTARRVVSALAALGGSGPVYTESGHRDPS